MRDSFVQSIIVEFENIYEFPHIYSYIYKVTRLRYAVRQAFRHVVRQPSHAKKLGENK